MRKLLEIGKEKRVKFISILVSLVLVASSVIYALASQKVTMTVTQVPNIDVVLTKAKTDVDLTNFEEDLLTSLEKKGITKDKVKISAVEAETQTTTESFSWERDVSSSIGSITITNNGQNVTMTGNKRNAGKNAIWIMPTGNQEQEFNFGYNINFGDSFNAAGMLLRVQRTGNTLTGYMLSFNNSTWKSAAGNSNGAIWEFTYPIGTNTTNFTKTFKKGLSINQSGTLNVKTTDKEIIVSGGGLTSPVTYTLEKSFGPGYGFFSDHYSHGCNNIGSFALTNINLKTVTVRDFNEVLRAPDWRDGACKVVVNVSDVTNEQFGNSSQLTEIISRLMNDDIHYIGWGTDGNKSEMEKAIAENDNKGMFLDNSDYEAAIEATAKYIKESLAGVGDSKYVIANEPVTVKINPSSEATGTADSNFPNGKWKVEHDYEYFENNEGQYANSGIYTENVITEFPKPGSYKVYYEDELITEIFAHRRPVASFNIERNGLSLTLTSTSSDLDKQSTNNGIQEEEWSYRKVGTDSWVSGKLTTLDANSTYIVKLRVKDYQDTWSTAATKYVTSENVALNPVAQFKITNKTISVYQKLEIVDSSYDPAGLELTSYVWTIKKGNTTVYTGAEKIDDYSTYGPGTYTMSLVVKNSNNKESEEFAQTFTITADTTAPEFIADITSAEVVNSTVDVNLSFTDSESGVKSYKYAITESKEEPTNWTTVQCTEANAKTFNSKVTISGFGKWYLHIKATDNDGNESTTRTLGIYNIQRGYTIELQAVDSGTKVGLQGAKFQVIGEYQNGKSIPLDTTTKTTNSNGKITLTDVPLIGLSSLKIVNTAELAGYDKNDTKVLTLDTTSEKIIVSSQLTSSDLETNVASDGQSITVKIPLTKKQFKLNITTVDATNNNIKISGAEFVLKYRGKEVARGTTVDGVLTMDSPIGVATGVADDFILQQVKAAPGYNTTSNTTLSVTFTSTGAFTSISQPLIGGNTQVSIPNQGQPAIIVKNTRSASGTFGLSMNIVNSNNVLNKIQGSTYKVRVETDSGLSYITESATSDANGNILYNDLFGTGIIKLTFIHEAAPSGYGINTTDRYITIENNNGTITYNQSSMSGIFQEAKNGVVYTVLTNSPKASTNSIRIKVYDKLNSSVGIQGVDFEVYQLIGNNKVGAGTTDEDGILKIDGIVPDGTGDVVYKILPVNQGSTNITSTILVSINFDSSKYATSANLVSGTDVNVSFNTDDGANLFSRIADVQIGTTSTEALGSINLKVIKQDASTGAKLEGAQYKVRFKAPSVYTKTYTTDANGEIIATIPEGDSIQIELTEVKAAEGYSLDSTTKKLKLSRDVSGKLVPVQSSYVGLSSTNVSVDENGNIVIVEQGTSLRNPKVKFKLAKTDKTGTATLGGVTFKVTNKNTGEFQNVTTNSSGIVETEMMTITEARDYTFEIEETQAFPGYELPEQPFTIRINFAEDGKIIKCTGEQYLTGDELLSKKESYYDEEKNEVEIELTIQNNEDENPSVNTSFYGIDIEKVNSKGEIVTGSKYDIEVRPYGTNVMTVLGKDITSDIEVPTVQLTENKTTILLKEVNEALGYGKEDAIKVITVYRNSNGELDYYSDTTSDDLKIEIVEVTDSNGQPKQVLKVTIIAKTPEEISQPNNGGNSSNPTNPDGNTGDTDVLSLLQLYTENDDSSATDGKVKNTAYKIDDYTYEVQILNTYLDTKVVAVVNDSSKVTIDTEETKVATASKIVDLVDPVTYVTIKVENSAGTKDKTYTLNLVKSDHNSGSVDEELVLQEVKVTDEGADKVASTTSLSEYEVEISDKNDETNLTITTKDPTAQVSISGEDFTTNTQTAKIVLVNDTTSVKVLVKNADGSKTQTFTVVIKKTSLEDDSIPAENDPDATFVFRLFNKNDGETWTRYYSKRFANEWWLYWYGAYSGYIYHGWWGNVAFDFTGAQRLPVFFKDADVKGTHSNWGKGYYLLNGFSDMKVEARLVQADGTVSSDIYETKVLRQNTVQDETNGSHTANFKKNYNNKEVEFTVIQEIPLENHKKFDTIKIKVKFDNDGKVISGEITQGLDTVDIAVGGISQGETISNIAYPNTRTDYVNQYWGLINSDVHDEIENYNSKGTNSLYVGILNKTIDNKFNIVLNLEDEDTNDKLNGNATIVVSEKDTSSEWKPIETIPVNIVDGTSKVNLSKTYANRHLRFTITQTSQGTLNGNTYTNPSNTSIDIELWLDDDGNIKLTKEIATPSAKLEDSPIGGNSIEYTIYNEKDYNFSIDVTKLDENGNPLPGVRLETKTVLITDSSLSTGRQIDTYGSKLTDENGYTKLKIVLPTTGANKYYGQTIDITIREYYVPDNYKAYKDIKVRVMFTSQGKLAVAPELISEPENGIVELSDKYTMNSFAMNIKNKQLTDKPSFEVTNIDSEEETFLIGDTQYKVTSWDEEEYENDHLTYKEQIYSNTSSDTDGMSNAYMDKTHALRTIIYTLQEVKTSESYETNDDIILKVKYDEDGKIQEMPEILSKQKISKTDAVTIVGNPVGYTMIQLKVRHEMKPKFTINITKYDTKTKQKVLDKTFRATSQVKQSDGTYGQEQESRISLQDDKGNIKIGFKEANNRETVLYTVYETTGDTETKRGQIEVEFDAYGRVLNASIVDPTNEKNYIEGTALNTSSNYINIKVNTEEFRMKVILKSTDSSSPYTLNGAKFDIQNEYAEVCDTAKTTDSSGRVVEIIGEVYRGETITYTIKEIEAPKDYDLIDDISFDVTFGSDGSISNCTPIMVQDKYAVTTTVKDDDGNNMEIEIFTIPSDREKVTVNAVDADDNTKKLNHAEYEIKSAILSSDVTLNLAEGTGNSDLGPDKNFFGKTVSYTITQTNIAEEYMICDKEIKVTVQYDIDGTIKDMYLQNPTDGTVKITNPTTGESSTSMLTNIGGYNFQIDMVNDRKTVMQLENQNIEDSNEKISNNTFKIIEIGKSDLYSDTKQTDTNGLSDMYVGPSYKAEAGETLEKTYTITNPTPAFGFTKIPDTTFTLKYDSNGIITSASLSQEAQKYLTIELISKNSSLYGKVDVRIVVKSTPTFTLGIEAVSETTGASITGMKYEVKQVSPTTGTAKTVITSSTTIAHADLGETTKGTTVTYEVVEKQVAQGYKYKDKDHVIARFEVLYDTEGHIIANSLNGERMNVTYGNAYFELQPTVDKTQNYDLDVKIKYEESEELTIKIKAMNRMNNSEPVISNFTANLSSSSATGTTDSLGELALSLGQRSANESGRLTITQNNMQGSFAAINTISLNVKFDENGKINISNITPQSGSNIATINVAYKILQPGSTMSYVIEIEVYNNPVTTFNIENVDQGDETIKLQSTFTLSATAGLANSVQLTTDAQSGKASTALESVPKNAWATYTIIQDPSAVPAGYGQILTISFRVHYDGDGLIDQIYHNGNGTSTADGTTVEITSPDKYTINIKIKSKRQFGVYIETVDAYDSSIKLGAQVYIKESVNRKSTTLTTQDGVGTANTILGTNIANSSLTYEVRLQNTPSGYYRDGTEIINVNVHFDINGNVDNVSYSQTPYTSNNCIVQTDRLNGVAVKITIKYIPNLTVNVARKDATSGNGISGKRIELSSNRMKNSPRSATTGTAGTVTFDGGRIASDDGTVCTYTINETNTNIDYNYQQLPNNMIVQVTYDATGRISSLYTNCPDILYMTGVGTRILNVEIKSSREAKIILYNSDYYLNTERISGNYVVTSSKGETTTQIVTPANTSSSSSGATPVTLGKVYTNEDVVYTIHNTDAKYGYELVDDIQFTVHYAADGTMSIDQSKISNPDRLSVVQINQSVTQKTAHINLEVKSKPCLMVKIVARDRTYNQGIEKLEFEITDDQGITHKATAVTDANGELMIPVKTARTNTTVHYTIKQITTNGGYQIINPLTLIVKYNNAGTIDENGTYISGSNIASTEQNYSSKLYANSKIRGVQVNIELETKLGIGIIKLDEDTNSPLQGVTFKVTEQELLGGSQTNTWNGGTDINGEMTTYTRNISGSVQKVRYTLTEVDPPNGYRTIEDIIFDVTFTADGRVQSVQVIQQPDGVEINPSNTYSGNSTYDLKKMDNSRAFVHIQVTVKNDNKVKFKIVNLDKGFKDSGTDVPVKGSEFNVTVIRDGNVVNTYDTANRNQLVTNANGEASIKVEGPGLLEIDYTQIAAGTGYTVDPYNNGFIKITKSANEYKITYNDSTDNIKYTVDDSTGEVTIYLYNENNMRLNINNVDIDDYTQFAIQAEQTIKAYYGDLTDSVSTIIGQTTNVVEYNNNFAYQVENGNLSIDLGNTYKFLNKKVVFVISTTKAPVGYNLIGDVYLVAEFDQFGRIVTVSNGDSERLIQQTKVNDYEADVFIGFGDLNKYSIKLVKESATGTRINDTKFTIDTYVNDIPTDIGVGMAPTVHTTQDRLIGTTVAEKGVIEFRKLEADGKIKLIINETAAAEGYVNDLGTVEVTFDCTQDLTNPLEPRPVFSNGTSNNNNVQVTLNNVTREVEIKVKNGVESALELEKVNDDGAQLSGAQFTVTAQVEGNPTTLTNIGTATTDSDGKLQVQLPTNFASQVMLVTLTENKMVGYKQLQPIVLRVPTLADGKINPLGISLTSGNNNSDGKGGAELTGVNSSKISVKVQNCMEESYKPFKLEIVKKDAQDSSITLENVQFQVKVTPDVGAPIYQVMSTDASGRIDISKVVGEGNIKIELLELIAPNGYKLGDTSGYFTFTINKTENGITEVTSTLGDNNLVIDSENRIVTASVPNELDKISIGVHKVDETNGMSIKNAKFELVDEETGVSTEATTNADGMAYFYVDKKTTAGTYNYTLKETGTPQGYKELTNTMNIEVIYNSDGTINDVTESGDNILLTEQQDKYIQVDVSNKQEPLNVPLYTIQIINADKANNSVVIPNSQFDIEIDQELGSETISQTLTMDRNGQNTISNINGSGKISIKINELIPGDGYKKDTNDKTVKLSRDIQTGRFTILEGINAYPSYDEANNKITIYVTSEKQKGIYSLVINKIDENGNPITTGTGEFEVNVNGNTTKAETDSNGQAVFKKLSIPDGNEFDISITETKKIDGYVQTTNSQILNAVIETIYEEKVLKDVTIKSGNAIALINKTESLIEISFMNQSEDGEDLYLTSDVYKVDDNYVDRVTAWTTIADYLTNMKSNGTMTIYDKNGAEVTDTSKYISTGMTTKAQKGDQEITKTVIVTGDVTGNGQIKLLDVSKVNQHFVGQSPLDGIYLKAADMSGDGKISILDVSKINQAFVNH